MRTVRIIIVALVVAALGVVAVVEFRPTEPLREVYTPTYRHVPLAPPVRVTLGHLWRDLRGPYPSDSTYFPRSRRSI